MLVSTTPPPSTLPCELPLARPIRQYAREQGWTILSRSWAPFGPGWVGSKNERLYDVTYRNSKGEKRQAFVETSAFAGVYVTEDRCIDRASTPPATAATSPNDEVSRLEQENASLRQRVAELEQAPPERPTG